MPVNWVRCAMPRMPFVISVYDPRGADGEVAWVDAGCRRLAVVTGGEHGSPVEVGQLYEAVLASTGHEERAARVRIDSNERLQ